MNAAHIHLMLNHFPLIGMIFSAIVLSLGLWRRNESLKRTGLFLVFFTGLFAIPTFLTGEPAEEIVENLAYISKSLIEPHEEAAEKVIWVVGCAATMATLGLTHSLMSGHTARWAGRGVLLLVLVSIGILGWVNNLGGKISHPEVRATE